MNFGTQDKCLVCQKTVYEQEKMAVDGKIYHNTCLRCTHCNTVIKLGNFAALEGRFYCKPHFKQLFTLKGNYAEGFGGEKPQAEWARQHGGSPASSPTVEEQKTVTNSPTTAAPKTVSAPSKASTSGPKTCATSPKGKAASPKATSPKPLAASPKTGVSSPKAKATSPKAVATSPKTGATSPRGKATSPKAGPASPKAASPKATATSPKSAGTSPKTAPKAPTAKEAAAATMPPPTNLSDSDEEGTPQSVQGRIQQQLQREKEQQTVDEEKKKAQSPPAGNRASVRVFGTQDKCAVCNRTVYEQEKITIETTPYHNTCLRCAHCNCVLKLGNYAGLGGKFYCKPHFKQLFTLKGDYTKGFDAADELKSSPGKDARASVVSDAPSAVSCSTSVTESSQGGASMIERNVAKLSVTSQDTTVTYSSQGGSSVVERRVSRLSAASRGTAATDATDDVSVQISEMSTLDEEDAERDAMAANAEHSWPASSPEPAAPKSLEAEDSAAVPTPQLSVPERMKRMKEKSAAFEESAEATNEKVVHKKALSFPATFGNAVKCAECNKSVYEVEKVTVDGVPLHKSCFRCCHCQGVLKFGNYAALDGSRYCLPHFKQLFTLNGKYSGDGFKSASPPPEAKGGDKGVDKAAAPPAPVVTNEEPVPEEVAVEEE